jgi:O-antigen/teichoic acid export membrane protein
MKNLTPQSGNLINPVSSGHFFKGLSWLILLNVIVKPLWIFGIDRQVQNVIGHETYGVYFSILNLSIILSFIADAGLTNMYNRQLALRATPNFKQLLAYKIVLSILYLLIFFFICWVAHVRLWRIVFLTGTLQVLASFLVFFRSIITGSQQFKADAWISIADKVIVIVVCGSILYLPFSRQISLDSFLFIQCASTFIGLAVAFFIAIRNHSLSISNTEFKNIFKLTYPFILLILLMGVHTRLDGFLLERMHYDGAFQAGVYAAAYRLLDAGNTAGYLAASFLVPYVARHLHDNMMVDETVMKLRHGLFVIAIPAAIIIAVFSRETVALLYHKDSGYYAEILSLCIAVLPAYYLVHLYGSLLTAKGLFKTFSLIIFICASINILLNILLIKTYGALGCCVAALVSQYTCGILCFFTATKAFSLSAGWKSVAYYLLLGIGVSVICYVLKSR